MARRGGGLDPAQARWSSLEALLATLIDDIRHQTWVYIQSKSDSKIPRPPPIRRPGLPERATRTIPLASAQRLDPRLRGLSDEEAQVRLDKITGYGKRGEN